MNVTCPKCNTEFSIPAPAYEPGKKARCGICRHVFALPEAPRAGEQPGGPNDELLAQAVVEEAAEDELAAPQAGLETEMNELLGKTSAARSDFTETERAAKPEETAKSGKGGKKFILLLLFLLILGGAGYFAYVTFFAGGGSSAPAPDTQVSDIAPADVAKVSRLDLKSSGVKYEYIRNDKLGPVLVLQGRVVNHFDTPKDYITIEARLLNSKGEVLVAKKQVAGVLLTPLQLSALGQRELVKALNNRIEIMANNVNVLPGQDVPFMVVFVYPPSNAVEIEVLVVDASDPPAAGATP